MNIEKNVPMPEVLYGKYSFNKMEVGDSVLFDGDTTASCAGYNSAKQYGRRYGKKFTGRKEGDGTVRIWRTA